MASLKHATSRRVLGKIFVNNSVLFLCDMQEKFRPRIKYFDEIVATSNRVLRASMVLDIPTIVTEQYPKGLGPTAKELGIEEFHLKPIPKTQLCMLVPEVEEKLQSFGTQETRSSVILCGIESHACIQQTALSLLERGYDVHVVVDACSSQNLVDRKYAFKLMRQSGAVLTTSESLILGLLKDANNPKFRQIQKEILTQPAPDTGLVKTPVTDRDKCDSYFRPTIGNWWTMDHTRTAEGIKLDHQKMF